MNIKLSLTSHCIETEIRKLYNRAVSDYFGKRGEKKEMEDRIETLQNALEKLDFGYLRNRHAELRGGSDASVILSADRKNELHIQINGEDIDAKNQI